MNILDILICPACHVKVSGELCCPKCGAAYAGEHGVFGLLNRAVSGDQVSLWGIDAGVFEDPEQLLAHNEKQQAMIEDYHAHINQESKDGRRS